MSDDERLAVCDYHKEEYRKRCQHCQLRMNLLKEFRPKIVEQFKLALLGDEARILDERGISRGTKCLGAYTGVADCKGAYPNGYLPWCKKMGWWGEKRIHLCSGRVKDPEGFKVDIRPEMQPDLIADARDTKLPEGNYDAVFIDPPYSLELAKSLYGTHEHYSHINAFLKEGVRLAKEGGLIIALSYNIPMLQKNCDLIAVWGIYEVPSVASMRCCAVFRKKAIKAAIKKAEEEVKE